MWEDLENGLEWFASAPKRWYDSGKKDLQSAAEWIWNVLEGDFSEEQSTAQVVTGTVISMIPFVDQLCDIRDVVANCKKINQDSSNRWAWVALVLTLIGLFPVLGSLAKGCGKILFSYGRKSVFKLEVKILESGFWKASQPWVESGIAKLSQHLQNPVVKKTLGTLRIYQPYHYMSGKIRDVIGKLNVGELTKAFDIALNGLRYFVEKIKQWGSATMATRAGELLDSILRIRNTANRKLTEVLAPVSEWLENLARRLELEGDMAYRAQVNALTPHKYVYPTSKDELAAYGKAKPTWVDASGTLTYPPRQTFNKVMDWPDISATSKNKALTDGYKTFHDLSPEKVYPGEKIYRVVAPTSSDNSICWMREAEFKALQNRDQWRRKFAVWANWNRNGEYITYTVPPGHPLHVWEGATASQALPDDPKFVLEGGGKQIVLDPTQLQPHLISKRRSTNWGYTDFAGDTDQFLGLPKLTNKLDSRNLPTP